MLFLSNWKNRGEGPELPCPKYKLSSLNGASTLNDFCVNRGNCASAAREAQNNGRDQNMWSWFSAERIVKIFIFFPLLSFPTAHSDSVLLHVCSLTGCQLSPLDSHRVAVRLPLFQLLDSLWKFQSETAAVRRLASSIPLLSRLHSSNTHLAVTLPPPCLMCTPARARPDTCLAQIAGGVTLRRSL